MAKTFWKLTIETETAWPIVYFCNSPKTARLFLENYVQNHWQDKMDSKMPNMEKAIYRYFHGTEDIWILEQQPIATHKNWQQIANS